MNISLLLLLALPVPILAAGIISAGDYPSIQAALAANPDCMIYVPAGDHVITEKIRIRGSRSGLFGPGRIIQSSNDQPVLEIENATDAEIRDVTLTRPEGSMETRNEGVLAIKCKRLVLDNVRVIDNWTKAAAISLRDSQDCRISRCVVRNYMRVSIDDRTQSPDWGYAFNCTDGTGISVAYCTGSLIEGNHVTEERLRPTQEIKKKHNLGVFVKKNPVKGSIISQAAWEANYTDNWQQGSGIIVTAPEVSDLTRILGNHIENAAQGIDLHADHVTVSGNIIVNSFMGMKAMHGSRNVLISGNQFIRNCLWAIGLMPGAAAHPGNADGGSIVASNIISDFGEGDAKWIWGEDRAPLKFDNGQQDDDPPLSDVVVTGNVVHHTGTAHYKYAVIIADPNGPRGPRNMHFLGNLFLPGTAGVSNTALPP